ncbi:MAG: hypothetical protein KC431_28015, partial [Myxococcales bacterium]|nr:hypothetical protein [Myxococcales bacterium]
MSDEREQQDAIAELRALERVFLRPQRVDLEQLAGQLGYRGEEPGADLWQRAEAMGLLPSDWTRLRGPAPRSAHEALLLASDPAGMLEAETCARRLVQRLAIWGCPQPMRLHWRMAGNPVDRPASGGPPLGAMSHAVILLRSLLVGGVDRIYEPPHAHRRMQLVLDVLTWRRQWRRMTAVPVPAEVRGPGGVAMELPAALVGRTLGELEDPLTPWLELIRTGYWLWRVEPDFIELAAPFPPPAAARHGVVDLRKPPSKRGRPTRAVWSQRLRDLRLACARGEPGWVRRGLASLPGDDEPGQPRLAHFAVYGGTEVLALLAEHGLLELDARDREDRTPLMMAAGLPLAGPAGADAAEIDVPVSEIVGAASCEYLLTAGCARELR